MTAVEIIMLMGGGGSVGAGLKWAWDTFSGKELKKADLRNKQIQNNNLLVESYAKANVSLILENTQLKADKEKLEKEKKEEKDRHEKREKELIDKLTDYKEEIDELKKEVGKLKQMAFFKNAEQ